MCHRPWPRRCLRQNHRPLRGHPWHPRLRLAPRSCRQCSRPPDALRLGRRSASRRVPLQLRPRPRCPPRPQSAPNHRCRAFPRRRIRQRGAPHRPLPRCPRPASGGCRRLRSRSDRPRRTQGRPRCSRLTELRPRPSLVYSPLCSRWCRRSPSGRMRRLCLFPRCRLVPRRVLSAARSYRHRLRSPYRRRTAAGSTRRLGASHSRRVGWAAQRPYGLDPFACWRRSPLLRALPIVLACWSRHGLMCALVEGRAHNVIACFYVCVALLATLLEVRDGFKAEFSSVRAAARQQPRWHDGGTACTRGRSARRCAGSRRQHTRCEGSTRAGLHQLSKSFQSARRRAAAGDRAQGASAP